MSDHTTTNAFFHECQCQEHECTEPTLCLNRAECAGNLHFVHLCPLCCENICSARTPNWYRNAHFVTDAR